MADFDRVIRLNLCSQVELANLALSHIAIAGGAADGEQSGGRIRAAERARERFRPGSDRG